MSKKRRAPLDWFGDQIIALGDAMERYCPTCGSVAMKKRRTAGSGGLSVFLWLVGLVSLLVFWPLILVPIAYTLYRVGATRDVCPACGNPGVIPVTSPKAQAALRALGPDAGRAARPVEEPELVPPGSDRARRFGRWVGGLVRR